MSQKSPHPILTTNISSKNISYYWSPSCSLSINPTFSCCICSWTQSVALSAKSIPIQFSSVQLLSRVQLFATSWTVEHQASLSITNSWSLLKIMSIKSEMTGPSSHLILCHPLLFLLSIFPSIRVFSSKSVLCIRWPKYWSFSFSISLSNEYSGLISFRIDWFDLLAVVHPSDSLTLV